jgi:WD40 repeat protein
MMPCPAVEGLLCLLAGDLDDARRTAIEEHVERCPRCQQALEELAEAWELSQPGSNPSSLRRSTRETPAFLTALADAPPLEDLTTFVARINQPLEPNWPSVPGYEILGELGRGGMGVVYKARQLSLNRLVALKMILAGAHAAPEQIARFRAEASAVARLGHPGIVQIYDLGTHDGLPFLGLEYVEGQSLARWLQGNPQPERLAAELIEALARIMQVAHERGIVHRDLKPANVLLSAESGAGNAELNREPPTPQSPLRTPKITDFGLVKFIDPSGTPLAESSDQTTSGAVLGTPAYMAPEQATGQIGRIGPATDIHALGVILYEMLTGRPPYLGFTSTETLWQVAFVDPTPVRRLQPHVSRDLETICLKCLEKEPARRYASALALAEDLQRYLSGKPIVARPASWGEQAWKWARRSPAAAALLTLAAFLLLGLGVGGAWFARREGQRAVAETELRHEAETNADLARSREEAARAEKKRADRALYFAHLLLARQAWDDGDLPRMRELLAQSAASVDADERGWEWHYLTHLERGGLRTLPASRSEDEGHRGRIHAVAFSADGGRVASAGADGTVRVWETATGRALRKLEPALGGVLAVAYSPAGKTLAAGGENGSMVVWDAASFEVRYRLKPEEGETPPKISALAFTSDGKTLAAGGSDGSVQWWHLTDGTRSDIRRLCRQQVTALAYNLRNTRMAIGSADANVILASATAEPESVFRTSAAPVRFTFSNNGTRLMAALRDGTVQRFDSGPKPAIPPTPIRPESEPADVTLVPEGSWLTVAGDDGRIRIWDAGSDALIHLVKGPRRDPLAIAVSLDGTRLACANDDGTLTICDVFGGAERQTPLTALDPTACAFSSDGRWFAAVEPTGVVTVWEVATAQTLLRLEREPGSVTALALNSHLGWLALGVGNDVEMWQVGVAVRQAVLRGHRGCVHGLSFGYINDQWLASASDDSTVRLWEMEAKERCRLTLPFEKLAAGQPVIPCTPRFDAVRSRLTYRGVLGHILDWSLPEGELLPASDNPPGYPLTSPSAPDSPRLVCDVRGLAVLKDGITARPILALSDLAPGDDVARLNGKDTRLVLLTQRGGVQMRETLSGQVVWQPRGYSNGMRVAFGPRDAYTAAFGKGTLSVWRAWPSTERGATRREAEDLVRGLFDRVKVGTDVAALIDGLQTISDLVRREAHAVLERWREEPYLLDENAWAVARRPKLKPDRYQQALSWALRALKLKGDLRSAWLTHALLEYRTGKYREARQDLERADPAHPSALAVRAMVLLRLNEPEEAQRVLQTALQTAARPPWRQLPEVADLLREAERSQKQP